MLQQPYKAGLSPCSNYSLYGAANTAYCLYPKRQATRSHPRRRAPEVKGAHDTLHHNLRGPPPRGGRGGVQPRQLYELREGPRKHSGARRNPGHPGPRLNRVQRTPIEVGREYIGRQPHDQQEWPNCGRQEASAPTKAIRRPAQNERSTRALPQAGKGRAW